MKNTRDGKQTTPHGKKVSTVYLNVLWNYITCGMQNIMGMVTVKASAKLKMFIKLLELLKKECIGHVQKRVGTALRKLKREIPGLGERRGKLTDGTIDKLQNYYGIAIRANVGNLAGIRKAIHASLMHCASSESRPLHDHSPTGSTSWCKYQQDRANRTNLYKHGPGLPLKVVAKVKPEYVRLSDDSLLEVLTWQNKKPE